MRIDAERARDIRITLVEGAQLLGSFDGRLREYAARKLHNQGIHLVKVRFGVMQLFPLSCCSLSTRAEACREGSRG